MYNVYTCKQKHVKLVPECHGDKSIVCVVKKNGLMDKTFGLSAVRPGVRIPGRGKCSLTTTAVDAMVKYPLFCSLYQECKVLFQIINFCFRVVLS